MNLHIEKGRNEVGNKLVGVLVSPRYGAGWSSWGDKNMALDQEIVEAIERGASYEEKLEIAERNWPGFCHGGLKDCVVEYVPEGTIFKIESHDGYERMEILYDDDYVVAKV